MATTTQAQPRVRLLTIRDLVDAGWGSRTQIWRMVRSGELPKPLRIGGRVVFREASLAKRLDQQEATARKA